MPLTDLSERELLSYRTSATLPDDAEEFWERTLTEARAATWPATLEPVETPMVTVHTTDVTFAGFGGHPIKAWYHRPAHLSGELPVVVRYQGYSCGRGLAHQAAVWAHAGYACLEVDTRGQGTALGGRIGHTADPAGSEPAVPGYLTRGISDREGYYYRRVFTDAVLAVDVARALPGVDGSRLAVAGGSQGGGIALAVAGLASGVSAVIADVPFLCDFRRGAEIAAKQPYLEIATYLAGRPHDTDAVFAVLAYFDAALLATRASAPALFSVALMDPVCPPSTVYAAFHNYGGPKRMCSYPFNEHEGGHAFHETAQLAWLAPLLGLS